MLKGEITMKKRLISMIVCLAMAALTLTGCSGGGSGKASGGKKEYTIAVLAWSMAEEFGVDIVDGAKAKAEEIGGIKIVSPDPAGDMQKEIAIFEDLIQQGVDAICVAPVDADAIVPYIDKVREKGIIVVDYDIETEAEVDAKILSDNKAGGAMAAEYLVKEMGTEGKVLVLTEVPGVTTAEERIAGFEEKMAEIAPNVEIVEQLSNGTRDTHRATTENMLQAHPDITGIFAFMGDNTLGAYTACKANNRTDVLIAGYDASGEQIEIMKNDGENCNLICSVALYPKKIGALSLETAYRILEGEKFTDTIYTELGLLEAKNVDAFEQ
jgi:ribose transport system substrate-binding protein